MRLIVHAGFHKTASTFLQHLLNRNAARLAERGIWYQPQPGYPAHHHAAWQLLAGDMTPLTEMIAEARAEGCETVILSSEDLEGAVVNRPVAAAIDAAARADGVDAVQWHVVLRDPGAYFASLYAQLQHHLYADALEMFSEVVRKGTLFRPEPMPGAHATPYWFYCFDYHAFLSGFAADGHHLIAHDYAADGAFPGWRMIDRLGAIDALVDKPDEDGHNRRLDADAVDQGYRDRIRDMLGPNGDDEEISRLVDRHIAASRASIGAFARLVGDRFGGSYAEAVAAFGAD
jgi:hypothetical protein